MKPVNISRGSKKILIEFSRKNRKNGTTAEKILWQKLRNRSLRGYKFRRQHPIHHYILDFYCAEKKLAIEADGYIHTIQENRLYDNKRTEYLESLGITVLRFSNEEIINQTDTVLNQIIQYIQNTYC